MRAFRLALCVVFFVSGCGTCTTESEPKKSEPGTATAPRAPAGRLIVLGFDGAEPRWLERWVEEGKLPNLARWMKAEGGASYRRLGSTNPPQSPVAWTSFATGTRPGDHGIFDFIRRVLTTDAKGLPVLPSIGTTEFQVHEVGPPTARNLRSGTPFWKLLSDDGVKVEAINIPYSFPPDPMRDGKMLSGLGVPDLRETNSTFTYAGTEVTEEQARRPPGGGTMVPIESRSGGLAFELEGPSIPGSPGKRMTLPVAITPDGEGAKVQVSGKTIPLARGEFSEWIELAFEHDGRTVSGICKMLLLETGARTRLFVTPISFHPRAPYAPFTAPNEYAATLADRLGSLYKTVGWDHDTSALNAEVIDDGAFLADMDSIERSRRAMLFDALGRDEAELLIWVSTAIDRVSHMFYRLIDPEHPRYDAALAEKHGDAIEREYRRMDETVGAVLAKLREGDTLLVMSDHGFHNYRRGLHLNQWLKENGYLATKGDAPESREFLIDVDWSRTKAYALGTGQIYVNLRGRERDGIVSRADAPAVLSSIREGLRALRDTERGDAAVVKEVYFGTDVFAGGRNGEAPDAQVAFAENYRTSWETILGGAPRGLFADNDRKWSGDHSASDVGETPGILLSNRRLRPAVEIVDLAPSAFAHFGKTPPKSFVGRPVFEETR